ncbi:MAG: hypothetical protein G3M78_04735 [Candidatus Nitrohelix vancouverensis]|uniref:Uncharacterized protein n=1 Tax=Candidatus Nitrohelix vancouverensis TaxID=2705534 RepID=A0A7T0C1M8_9BACT|nr:MAG: hypothetical protein G3M78_04735 [Candidatus Nitrohelix vancouverensis]
MIAASLIAGGNETLSHFLEKTSMSRNFLNKFFRYSAPVLLCFVLGGGIVEAQSDSSASQSAKAWAVVDGFRSASFGMNEKDVLKAISKDFGIGKKNIERLVHPTEKTTNLSVAVSNLLPESGQAQVIYSLGYQSKRLMNVNILWGQPFDDTVKPQSLLDTANALSSFFSRQRFDPDGLLINADLKNGNIIVFRGKDQKGRMVLIHLTNPTIKEGEAPPNLTLRLSYIADPSAPDIFHIKKGDF